MSWMLRISKHFSLQNALMYTAVFEEMAGPGVLLVVAPGRRSAMIEVWWAVECENLVAEVVHQPTGAIAKVDVAQDRATHVCEI